MCLCTAYMCVCDCVCVCVCVCVCTSVSGNITFVRINKKKSSPLTVLQY